MENKNSIIINEENAFKQLKEKIFLDIGVDFRDYKEKCLKRRIRIRMRSNKVETYKKYIKLLTKNPDEYHKLLDTIMINVTRFFRNIETFNAMEKNIFPELFLPNGSLYKKNIRIWSAACSSGEEPYSIAILVDQFMKLKRDNIKIDIIATDIDKKSIEKAKEGVYTESSLKEASETIIRRYFKFDGENYSIIPSIRQMVKFENNDIIHGKMPARLDWICCRNVLIYWGRDLQDMILRRFYEHLVPGGFLLLGKTEIMLGKIANLYERVNNRERIFRRPF